MVARWPRRAVAVARNPHLWAILILFVLCSVYHYSDYFGLSFLQFPSSVLEPTRHAVDRVFYLLPIIYAGYVFGATAGLVVTSFALVLMLPRALFISPSPPDALLESAAVVVVGVLANLWLRARARETRLATERGHAVAAMVRAQEKLREQVRSRMKFEKDLTVLASLSELLVQSAEMGLLLRSAIDMVVDVIKVEVVLIFTLDEGAGELVLVAQEGLSNESARALDRMRIGEGFNGRVAATGEPLVVRDVTQDPRLTREAVRQEKLQAQLIVPMKSMGRVVGTICVATRGRR